MYKHFLAYVVGLIGVEYGSVHEYCWTCRIDYKVKVSHDKLQELIQKSHYINI